MRSSAVMGLGREAKLIDAGAAWVDSPASCSSSSRRREQRHGRERGMSAARPIGDTATKPEVRNDRTNSADVHYGPGADVLPPRHAQPGNRRLRLRLPPNQPCQESAPFYGADSGAGRRFQPDTVAMPSPAISAASTVLGKAGYRAEFARPIRNGTTAPRARPEPWASTASTSNGRPMRLPATSSRVAAATS